MIVADASAVLELLLNTRPGAEIARHLFADNQSVHVPHLLDLEVLQGLRRFLRVGVMGGLRTEQARRYYESLPFHRYPHTVLASRIWALRHNWTAYDAAYLALAEVLDAPLVTCDRAMASNSGHRAKILLV